MPYRLIDGTSLAVRIPNNPALRDKGSVPAPYQGELPAASTPQPADCDILFALQPKGGRHPVIPVGFEFPQQLPSGCIMRPKHAVTGAAAKNELPLVVEYRLLLCDSNSRVRLLRRCPFPGLNFADMIAPLAPSLRRAPMGFRA